MIALRQTTIDRHMIQSNGVRTQLCLHFLLLHLRNDQFRQWSAVQIQIECVQSVHQLVQQNAFDEGVTDLLAAGTGLPFEVRGVDASLFG